MLFCSDDVKFIIFQRRIRRVAAGSGIIGSRVG